MAGGRGFEPLLAESESAVLPLDEPPIIIGHYVFNLTGITATKKEGLVSFSKQLGELNVLRIVDVCVLYVDRLSYVQPHVHRE